MSLYKAMQNLKFDKRLTESNLNTGTMSKEEWNQHLEKLPDMAHNVETLTMETDDSDDATETH